MPENVVAAQLYTVRQFTKNAKEVAQTLKKVADIGYTAVQISAFGDVSPAEVAKMCADNGLRIISTHTNWQRFVDDIDGVIQEHEIYGCKHPAIGGLFGEYRSVEGLKRFLDEFGPVGEKLAAAGMDFSYHNHSHEFARYGGKTWMEMLFEQMQGNEVFKFELDVYWVQHGGADPAYWVRKCAGREPLLHLKDMAITPDREQRFAEVGEGNLNWPAILQAAQEGGVEWYCVEQDQCYERDPFESLAISYRHLKEWGFS
ncbi:MAG: sugar phosphate isomerase/epimerase [Chloroflexi bacterium]|nr:sugar phosphate isomerase/epimerase [Chloroflexota bacterium]